MNLIMNKNVEYAICIRNCSIKYLTIFESDDKVAASASNQTTLSSTLNEKIIDSIDIGQLIKIIDNYSKKYYKIKLYNVINKKLQCFNNYYLIIKENLTKISINLWPFIISIDKTYDRYLFINNIDACNYLFKLKINDIIIVNGLNNNFLIDYNCIIRYIGLVPEIGPGYYFGVELLNLDNGYSPQENLYKNVLNSYMTCDDNLSLLITGNFIKFNKEKLIDNFSKKFNLTLRRSKRNFLINNNNNTAATLSSSAVTPKKMLNTNDVIKHLENECNPMINRCNQSSQTNPTSASNNSGSNQTNNNNNSSNENSAIIKNLDHNEDYLHYVENYEKILENKYDKDKLINKMNTKVKTKYNNNNTKATQMQNQLPQQQIHAQHNDTTIMSLEDRDLVIIDNNDINESSKMNSEIIVVDKNIDLMDLLGNNWPVLAGDTGQLLNNDKKIIITTSGGQTGTAVNITTQQQQHQQQPINNQRNKSMNPLSHLITTATPTANKYKKELLIKKNLQQYDNNYDNDNDFIDYKRQHDLQQQQQQQQQQHNYNQDNESDNMNIAINTNKLNDSNSKIIVKTLNEIVEKNLQIGTMIEITLQQQNINVNSSNNNKLLHGVIRFIGYINNNHNNIIIGVELDDDLLNEKTCDGTYINGQRLFKCNYKRGLFIKPEQCSIDRRFVNIDDSNHDLDTNELEKICNLSSQQSSTSDPDILMYGHSECPVITGFVPPLKVLKTNELEQICGKFKGIQGHNNSCYLDATLFSMFTFTSVFDTMLYRPSDANDSLYYNLIQNCLRDEIINPLRKNLFVRYDCIMKLRKLLDRFSSITGLINEEKDPEEFLNSLITQILRIEPFLKLNSGQDTYFYQLFIEKDEHLVLPTVQQLFEQSFLQSDIKLKEVPSCLIIQMPRFGKNYKMYPRILPSQVLDVTDIIEDSPRQCTVCGKLAEYECKECYGMLQCGVGLESTAFCKKCLDTAHSHAKRLNHSPREISVPSDFKIMEEHCPVPRLFMELFAVLCIETSHYVTFVKAGPGQDAPWCFFDSMADRKGEQNGYNIPEMISVNDLPKWLSEDGARNLNEQAYNDKMLPEHAKRLLCDAYMCMYQSTDVMMYR